MTFAFGVLTGILVTVGVALVVSNDIDNNTDFR
jgi:hypothetical protein